jgi:hypothetical protein
MHISDMLVQFVFPLARFPTLLAHKLCRLVLELFMTNAIAISFESNITTLERAAVNRSDRIKISIKHVLGQEIYSLLIVAFPVVGVEIAAI